MSSLHIIIFYTILIIVYTDNKNNYFTQLKYDIWCQENILSNSLFLYPNRIPIGIYSTSNIKSVLYHIINDMNNDLFTIHTKYLANFYFVIINITRPLDINREYQDIYIFHIQANIITIQGNYTEQAEIHLHVADSNDNDAVFDMDIYEKTFIEPIEIQQSLIHFHASDADEIQHAQIIYELSSSLFNDTFSLHPFTGELYLISKKNIQSIYEFDIYAYDRHRKYFINNNIKTKAHVKLIFSSNTILYHQIITIFNETIKFNEIISSYKILFSKSSSNWNLLNIHQPILTIKISPYYISKFELFILNNSSLNSINLFIYENKIYLNNFDFQEYNLHLLICFFNRTKCQYSYYNLIPSINFDFFHQFYFPSIQPIFIEENLPVQSFLTYIHVEYNHDIISNQQLIINYKLLNNDIEFNLHPKTGILRLNKYLINEKYFLDIQADIYIFNKSYSIKTNIEINIKKINKYRPKFSNYTYKILYQLPYQFQAYDFDENKQTNGRITYDLLNCSNNCPFQINSNNGILNIRKNFYFIKNNIYYLQIRAFDWGEPINFETKINIQINLSKNLIQQDLDIQKLNSEKWINQSLLSFITMTEESIYSSTLSSNIETIYLNIGFNQNSTSYYLSEDTEINTIIDYLTIEYDSFPLFINNENDNICFYIINDTSIPFTIDQNEKTIILIYSLDREKQDQYIFEIELKLKSVYITKLQEIYNSNQTNKFFNFQYSNKYYQKMLVTIYINDINDNIPICNYFHQHIYLNENQLQTNMFHVQAFDSDLNENGTIIYSLLNYNEYFTINSYTGQIDCIQTIDYEQISYILLYIIASDQGQHIQLQSICMTLHVTIVDINDNIPHFSLTNYTYYLFSDLPQNVIFGQIYGIDADLTDNLIYLIDSNPYVKINKYTGHLRLKYDLHNIINQNLNITVRISDGLHTNQTWIYVYIKRFIDAQEPILLSEPAYNIIINQSLPIGAIVTNVYHHLQILQSSIDYIEIINEENIIPFSIDQQGSIRLIHSLTDLSNSSYWLSIRLTRYRARPPHSFIHIHISIQEEDFYQPQCINIYQNIKIYEYSIPYEFVRVQALSFYDHIHLQYSIINDDINKKKISINKQTGSIQLLSSFQNNYLLTIRALDNQHKLSVDCYIKIDLIRRRQLIPKFIYSPIHNIDLIEISSNSTRLRQRLFQVIALLDHKIYNKNLEIRYRIIDSNQYFIINRQTGYIAAKQPLYSSTTYEFNVEAFTIAHYDDIESNRNDDTKWHIVSSRIILPIKIRIIPINITDNSLSLTNISTTFNISLLTTTKVGTILLQLKTNNNHQKQWFIITSHINHTRYFHVNFQSGELILIRPIEELFNETTIIELYINVTIDWIRMNTIKIIVHIINNKHGLIHFSQTDYYSSISKNLPIGIKIATLTVENSMNNCTYNIHSVERIKTKDFFRIDPYLGSIIIIQSLEKSINKKHLLTITYYCQYNFQIVYTRLHINILDKEKSRNNSYRFRQDNYLVIFETSLINNQKKYLINFELINNDYDDKRIKPDAQIIEGDPLGLFSIDSSNQSLYLIDESLSRSYIYPIQLTIIDTSQIIPINCTVTIFISNIGIQFTCPSQLHAIPYLLTYESIPPYSIDPLTGQQYDHYDSFTIHGFDPLTPSNTIKCSIKSKVKFSNEIIDFIFEKDIYYGYINNSSFIYHNEKPIYISIKDRNNYSNPFDITYEFINQTNINLFQLDQYTGIIKYISKKNLCQKYSLIILAKYQSLITLTRLNIFINYSKRNFYKFKLFKPFINNYTIGYINKKHLNLNIFNKNFSSRFSIDNNGRLFIKNQTLILFEKNFYKFSIENIYIEINIFSKEIIQCSLNRYISSIDNYLIGSIEILNKNKNNLKKNSFILLNYNYLFLLHREYGLLYYHNQNQIFNNDLILLIEIDNSRCLITIDKSLFVPTYLMIRKETNLEMEIHALIDTKQSTGQIKLHNGTLITFDIIPNHAPICSQRSYTFSLDITHNINKTIFIGQVSAIPYNINRSHLVYHFLSSTKYFIINPDSGIIEYIPNKYYNKTIEQLQVIIRDIIYQQNTTINITIYIFKQKFMSLSSRIYHQIISEILPIGSIIFQPNISSIQHLQYSLDDYNENLFTIDSNTGQVTLLNYLSDSFYSFKIRIYPINEILIIKLTILDYNNHSPIFLNLPLNITISSNDLFVTKITAYDLDLYDNENLKYYLLNNNAREIFSIEQKTGIITLKTFSNENFFQLKIGVSDGLHLTTNYLLITIDDYTKNFPTFSSNKYIFEYNKILGQISAYDSDLNDKIFYQLYLEPDGIKIDQYTGLITIHKELYPDYIEFYASASDRVKQIVYTKIQIYFPSQPKFTSNLYIISLVSSMKLPSEIFHFQLVNFLNQSLTLTKFKIKEKTYLIEINDNKLILKKKLDQTKIYYFNIYGYWKNFTCQTTIQIQYVENIFKLNKNFYEFFINENFLKENYFIKNFQIKNFLFKILSTPLTRNNCIENFYFKQNKLYFKNYPILSSLCFFEIQLSNNKYIYLIQIKIQFIHTYIQPKFLSKIFYFYYLNNIRIFAKSSNPIRYKLQTNSYGLIINQTTGIISCKYISNRIKNLQQIQLLVYAIDDKTYLNDTALINIIFNKEKHFHIPTDILSCPNTPKTISDQSLPGTIIQDIHHRDNNSNQYYILSGDKYGLFAINNFGQIFLASSILNRTSDEYFELIILISSSSIFYCRTNISIIRLPKWSYFTCPVIPIEWIIEEESPIGTRIGNIKDSLLIINNNLSQFIEQINLTLINNNDSQSFLFNSSTGLFISNSRLDYEQKTFYSFSILLNSNEFNCLLTILIKLININDNSIFFDQNSLIYTINVYNPIPFYIGRIRLIDIDQLHSLEYKYYLKNFSSQISIDSITGSIILYEKFNRKFYGEKLQYEILAIDDFNQKNLTDILIININNYKSLFEKDIYYININKSSHPGTIIFQITTLDYDSIINENIHYYLINSSSIFSIDKYTGYIYLNEFIPSIIINFTLIIEAIDNRINLTDRINIFISIIDDDYIYFNLENRNQCFINENQPNGTKICTIGKDSIDFIYYLIDPMNLFDILSNNGTIINRKIFNYDIDEHEYNMTIIVQDRKNQSILLSSLNLTIYLRNLNDNSSKFLTDNLTTLVYFFYPSINTILYKIQDINKNQSNLTYKILNNINSLNYSLRIYSNLTELILIKPILNNREDILIIRIWNNSIFFIDINIRLIYFQYYIEYPQILTQTIDGYINFEKNSSIINLGQLFIQKHSQYKFIYFNLISHENFFLKQLSNNQTELYFKSFCQTSLRKFQIYLTAIIIHKTILKINFSNNNTKFFFPSIIKPQLININLWPINHNMLNQTISLRININSNTTYEQFIIHNLSLIRQNLAKIIGINITYIHIYTFELKFNQIELLIAILHSTSEYYLDKKFLYNILKNSTNIFDKIFIDQCQLNSCENNALCISYIYLLNNQYNYFYYNTYQHLIPKYQWNIKCLCQNFYYGERCQFKKNHQSPCLSNPCLSMEKCIEINSTLYSCQCIDKLCNYKDNFMKNSFQCININSPTCRNLSNTLTFDGYSFVQINLTMNIIQSINITLSFRTYSIQGNLFKLIYFDEKTFKYHQIILQIIDGYITFKLNEKILLQLNQILINDGQWHDIYFLIDYFHLNNYYLLRLDHVFSNKNILLEKIQSNKLIQLIFGTNFNGCLSNLTFNNQIIHTQQYIENSFIDFIGTNNGCNLSNITQKISNYNDICSLYHPCYHGGICTNYGLNFICNCSNSRFTGRQCQLDLYPCESYPCQFNEQCISFPLNLNKTFICVNSMISLSILTKRLLYIGLIIIFSICILLIFIIYYRKKQKENFIKDKPLVTVPLIIHKSSSITNHIDNSMKTLLKLNYKKKQINKTMIFTDNNHNDSIINRFNNRSNNYKSHKSLNDHRNNLEHYSSIEQINNPSDNLLVHYSSIDYDNVNIHDRILLTPLINNRDRKHSYHFNHNNISTSTLSSSKEPIYARIVKTPKIANSDMKISQHLRLKRSITLTSTSFIKSIKYDNNDTNELIIKAIAKNRLRHASDSDLLNKKKSFRQYSFFQTEV